MSVNVQEKIGDFLLDIAKLIIGGIIIGGMMEDPINRWVLYGLGSFICIFIIIISFALLDNIKDKEVKE